MKTGISFRLKSIHPDILLFLGACCFWGFSTSVGDAIFNNFLNESFQMSNLKRSLLEVPRELPGLSVVFISALFFFLCSRRLAALAMLFTCTPYPSDVSESGSCFFYLRCTSMRFNLEKMGLSVCVSFRCPYRSNQFFLCTANQNRLKRSY